MKAALITREPRFRVTGRNHTARQTAGQGCWILTQFAGLVLLVMRLMIALIMPTAAGETSLTPPPEARILA